MFQYTNTISSYRDAKWPVDESLAFPPSLHDIHRAKSLSNGKAPEADGIPPEVYKIGECQ